MFVLLLFSQDAKYERSKNVKKYGLVWMKVNDRVVIITGASSGIGLATARLLSKQGAKLALVSRTKQKLINLSHELPNSLAIPTDMTKIDEIKRMVTQTVEHFRRIDVLINCVGQGYDAPVEKINIEIFRRIFNLDVVGPVVVMEQVIPFMRKQGGGTIVNVSSGTALMYLPYNGAYSALKRGLAHISLTAREELKKDNIVVSVVYPYITLTDFEKNTLKNDVPKEEQRGGPPFPPDTAEYVAGKILEGIESGEAEILAHDWMKERAGGGQ
jgi:short-subunit dehydrogenase